MSELLPNFGAADCTNFVLCATVGDASKEFIAWLKKDEVLVVRMRVGEEFYYARMFGNYRLGKRRHFHIEFKGSESFGSKPTTHGTQKRFFEILKLAEGAPVDVRVIGSFFTPRDRLPEGGIIRTLSAETTAAGVSMQLTQGSLKLRNSTVSRLSWVETAPDMFAVSVEANKKTRINNTYFGDIFAWLLNLYELSVFNETKGSLPK